MTPYSIAVVYLVTSLTGVTALAMPVEPCDQCGEDRPIKHDNHRTTGLENLS